MKTDLTYESPQIQIVVINTEAVFCVSLVYGREGSAGDDLLEGGDIYDGGSF